MNRRSKCSPLSKFAYLGSMATLSPKFAPNFLLVSIGIFAIIFVEGCNVRVSGFSESNVVALFD